MKAQQEVLEPRRCRAESVEVERLAVSVRKLLQKFGQGKHRRLRARIDDAVKVAGATESVASFRRRCPAADVVECELLLDALASQLQVMLDRIFAS